MIPEDPRGLLVERGDSLARVTAIEYNARSGRMVRLRGCRVLGGPECRWWIPWAELRDEWRVLDEPDALPEVAVSSCLRCRRMNFGPCISATCVDLQVPA